MSFKTKYIGILSLTPITPCFAGFYLGAGVGPEGGYFTQRAHIIKPGTFDAIDTNHFAGKGIFGSIMGGYYEIHNRFYLAGEINANVSSLKYQLTNLEFVNGNLSKTTFKVKNNLGFSILPGYVLDPHTVLFARVGYANGHIVINQSDPTIRSMNARHDGFRYGLGIKHTISKDWDLLVDYSQIHYRGFRGSVYEPFGNVTKDTKISPNTAQVQFGVLYNFDAPVPVTK